MDHLYTGGIKDFPSDGEWKGWRGCLCWVGDGIGLKLAEKRFKWERKEFSWWMAELEVCTAGLLLWWSQLWCLRARNSTAWFRKSPVPQSRYCRMKQIEMQRLGKAKLKFSFAEQLHFPLLARAASCGRSSLRLPFLSDLESWPGLGVGAESNNFSGFVVSWCPSLRLFCESGMVLWHLWCPPGWSLGREEQWMGEWPSLCSLSLERAGGAGICAVTCWAFLVLSHSWRDRTQRRDWCPWSSSAPCEGKELGINFCVHQGGGTRRFPSWVVFCTKMRHWKCVVVHF